ncbi:sporulation integral membrane protein YtvI [Cohnella nanjingensis]|uniref:sporulation integral membrane protein YtvI n=1 Tax=Cohnella nanjingensis TaxID=1387779 RepID=UPI0028A912D4|nr:sporulation integral membrane protein YtvI [Cohnella nanjingensis]
MILIVLGLAFLYLLFTVGAPFLLALVVVIFLEPLNRVFMDRLQMNRVASAILSSTLFTIVLLGLMGLIGLKVVGELTSFWGNVPDYLSNANQYLQHLIEHAQSSYDGGRESDQLPIKLESWMSSLTSALQNVAGGVSRYIVGFAAGIPNFFIVLIVFLVAVYLFGISLPTMKSSVLALFADESRSQVEEVMENLRKSIFGFLRAQLLLSLMTYVITFFGLLIIGTGYPLAIALLIVIVDILPILGTGSVLVPWAAYMLATGDSFTGIGLILLFLVITVVRRIIEPKILGDAVGIGALPALISLYVGYELVGLIGVFLGPAVVIVFIACRKVGLIPIRIKL